MPTPPSPPVLLLVPPAKVARVTPQCQCSHPMNSAITGERPLRSLNISCESLILTLLARVDLGIVGPEAYPILRGSLL